MIPIDLLKKLNNAVDQSGEAMEGNICYHHQQQDRTEMFRGFDGKRRNLQKLAKMYNNILEIGFNAGHSSAIMLSSDDQVTITSVDIATHAYVKPCAKIIDGYYPSRHQLLAMSSRDLLPKDFAGFDCIIIDGDHSYDGALSDLQLTTAGIDSGTCVVLDDWEIIDVQRAWHHVMPAYKYHSELDNTTIQTFWIKR